MKANGMKSIADFGGGILAVTGAVLMMVAEELVARFSKIIAKAITVAFQIARAEEQKPKKLLHFPSKILMRWRVPMLCHPSPLHFLLETPLTSSPGSVLPLHCMASLNTANLPNIKKLNPKFDSGVFKKNKK
jgi:hypothetical protein